MKSEIQNNDVKPELPFPKLMTSNKGVICIMTEGDRRLLTGMVVNENDMWEMGHHADNWDTQSFKDFNGTVTLSN